MDPPAQPPMAHSNDGRGTAADRGLAPAGAPRGSMRFPPARFGRAQERRSGIGATKAAKWPVSALSYRHRSGYVSAMGKGRRIWPHWLRSVGDMIDNCVIVRLGCPDCRTFFDVDLRALERARGRGVSLIDARPSCKVTRCRGSGFFVAARRMQDPLTLLLSGAALGGTIAGLRAADLEPPQDDPPDPVAIAMAKNRVVHCNRLQRA